MNIFYLDSDPVKAAQMQCDKHVTKMSVESAQMLSVVHRVLDGSPVRVPSKTGKRMVVNFRHPNPKFDAHLYKTVHQNHPCTLWTMESAGNYRWHLMHWVALCREYTFRYGRDHESYTKLLPFLGRLPKNINPSLEMTPIRLAMKDHPNLMKIKNPVEAYQKFYLTKLERFDMKWTRRNIPEWFIEAVAA